MDRRRQHQRDLEMLGLSPQHFDAGGVGVQLSKADFEELERLGNAPKRPIAFSDENKGALNEAIAALCMPENDKLAPHAFTAAAEMIARLSREAGSMRTTLRLLQNMTGQGSRLAVLSLFPMERAKLGGTGFTGEGLGQPYDMATVLGVVETVASWAERKVQELHRDTAGRPLDEWSRLFVTTVANAFEAAGGIASASSKTSPFLRVLGFVNQRLPAERRIPENMLAGCAKGILSRRKQVQNLSPR
jgi:hypothetical protein